MHNAQHNPLGFEGHAMLLSLPPVLLVWAIVAFSAAIVAYALQPVRKPGGIESPPAWIVLAVFVLILGLVSMGLYTFSIIWKWQSPTSRFVRLFSSRSVRTRGSKETGMSGLHNDVVS